LAKPHRLAIVTGTSSGIGEAVALELLRRDWQVVGIARRRALIDDARYRHLAIDLADIAHLTEAMESALGERVADPRLARLALVNNAADPGLLGPVTKIEPGAMLRVYAVNVVAPAAVMLGKAPVSRTSTLMFLPEPSTWSSPP